MFPLASVAAKARQQGGIRSPRADDAALLAARAPALKDAAGRVVSSLVKSLQTMAGATTTVEGALAGLKMAAKRDLPAGHRPGSVAAAIECPGLSCTLLATLDAALVHALVELLCGGSGSECSPDEMRQATLIDAQYAQIVMGLVSGAITAEWASRGFGTAKPIKIEGAPSSDVCGAKIDELVVAHVAITLFGLRGLLTLALPPKAVDAFAPPDEDAVALEATADPRWSTSLKREVERAEIRIDVLLAAQPLSLRAIAQLKVGQMLVLPSDARTQASLVCDGRTLYRGEIGQSDDVYSLRIDEVVPAQLQSRDPGQPFGKSPLKTMLKA